MTATKKVVGAAAPSATNVRHLARVRRICLALPGAWEKTAWSAPTFRVGERQFAVWVDGHHGEERAGVWCKAAPGLAEALVDSDPKRFFIPPYVGGQGWIGIRLAPKPDWKLIDGLLADAHALAAAKRKPRKGR